MTALHEHDQDAPERQDRAKAGHGRRMMIACWVPMLAITLVIAASGAGFGFLVLAVMCTAMMAMMMGGMSHGGGDDHGM